MKNEFKNQFNEKINATTTDNSEETAKKLLNNNKKTIYKHNIQMDTTEDIIKKLSNGKAPGLSGVQNEAFKNYKGVNLIEITKKFMEMLLNHELDNLNIIETIKFKYLGHEISNCINGSDIKSRRIKTSGSIYNLKSLGFFRNELSLNTKSLMYKVYCLNLLFQGYCLVH